MYTLQWDWCVCVSSSVESVEKKVRIGNLRFYGKYVTHIVGYRLVLYRNIIRRRLRAVNCF